MEATGESDFRLKLEVTEEDVIIKSEVCEDPDATAARDEYYAELDFTDVGIDDELVVPDGDPLSACRDLEGRSTASVVKKVVINSKATLAQFQVTAAEAGTSSVSQEEQTELEEMEAIIQNTLSDSSQKVDTKVKVEDSSADDLGGIVVRSSTGKVRRPRPCLCTICNIGFPTQDTFEAHRNKLHSDKLKYPCGICGKRFRYKEQRNKHEIIHDKSRFSGDPKYACEFCDNKYYLKVSLAGHRRIKHLGYKKPSKKRSTNPVQQHHSRGVRRPEPEIKPEKPLYSCSYCDLKFDYKFKLIRHTRVHTKEKPFQCKLCQQPFTFAGSLRLHMKTVHQNGTAEMKTRPKFMANEPCPCTVCERVFKVPSQLKRHMRLHTGELPYKCELCQKRFRMGQSFRKHNFRFHQPEKQTDRTFLKCLICGKDKFLIFSDFRNHRTGRHRNVPYEKDKEKPFGCGICGKPCFTRGQAMICAILGHDPSTLLKAMFKHKCPECPEETFGFHNLMRLRKHWEIAHSNIIMPVELRKGLYQNLKDTLPKVTISKEKAKDIIDNGPSVKYEYPLFTEFDLFPIDPELRKNPRKKAGRKPNSDFDSLQKRTCHICGLILSRTSNMKRHIALHSSSLSCTECGKIFRKLKTLRQHEKTHQDPSSIKRSGRSQKASFDKDKGQVIVSRYVSTIRDLESIGNSNSYECTLDISQTIVNVHDTTAVKNILGNRSLQILLTHCDIKLPKKFVHEECQLNLTELTSVNVNDMTSIRDLLGNQTLRVVLHRLN